MPETIVPSLLDREVVLSCLPAQASGLLGELDVQRVIDSTNAEALRRIAAGAGAGLVCVAEQQTAGRGRRGRNWISPYASNLYMSVVAEFSGGIAVTQGLSLAAGVAVTDALQQIGLTNLQLKWPNDILHGNAKLGGILIEMSGDANGVCQLVIGIGLNVCMPAVAAAAIGQRWTDISRAMDAEVDRNKLLSAVLGELLPLIFNFEEKGFAHWRQRWLERDAYAGERVVVSSAEQEITGRVEGIDESGALLLDTGSGIEVIHGGEVSLRPQA